MTTRRRNKLDSIIHGRKFIGTLITDDYQIENIEVYVYARHSNDIRVRIKVASSHPEYKKHKNLLFSCYLNETYSMAVKFSLQCYAKNGDKLIANGIRFRGRNIVGNEWQDKYVNAKFHVKEAVLTKYGKHTSMVKFGLLGIISTQMQRKGIETEIGDIWIERGSLGGKKLVGSLAIVPPTENHYDNWHKNAHKFLQDIVSIIGFLMGRLITITFEEHRYPDRSELHFREKIEAHRPEEFLITTNWGLISLVNRVVSRSKKDSGFIEIISSLAAVVTMANTYSPYWRGRVETSQLVTVDLSLLDRYKKSYERSEYPLHDTALNDIHQAFETKSVVQGYYPENVLQTRIDFKNNEWIKPFVELNSDAMIEVDSKVGTLNLAIEFDATHKSHRSYRRKLNAYYVQDKIDAVLYVCASIYILHTLLKLDAEATERHVCQSKFYFALFNDVTEAKNEMTFKNTHGDIFRVH